MGKRHKTLSIHGFALDQVLRAYIWGVSGTGGRLCLVCAWCCVPTFKGSLALPTVSFVCRYGCCGSTF